MCMPIRTDMSIHTELGNMPSTTQYAELYSEYYASSKWLHITDAVLSFLCYQFFTQKYHRIM
jgi:hypothetical protein